MRAFYDIAERLFKIAFLVDLYSKCRDGIPGMRSVLGKPKGPFRLCCDNSIHECV